MESCGSVPTGSRRPAEKAASAGFVLAAVLLLASSGAEANVPPVVDSFTASATWALPGGVVNLSLQAHDPDCVTPPCTTGCGATVRSDLTAYTPSGGSVTVLDPGTTASPFAATATWTAPAIEGTYTIDVTLSDSGTSMCGGRLTATARVSVTVSLTPLPVVDSFTATPTSVLPGQSSALSVTAHDTLGRPLSYAFAADAGTVSQPVAGAPAATWTAPTGFFGPVAVRCTVTPAGGNAIVVQASVTVVPGIYQGTLPGKATRLAALADGRIAIADTEAGSLRVVDGAGTVSWTAQGFAQAVAVAAGPENVYVLDRGQAQVAVFTLSGTRLAPIPLPAGIPVDLAFGPGLDEISVTDAALNRVWVLAAASGLVRRTVGDGVLVFPAGLACFDGKTAVANPGNQSVTLFDATGAFVSNFTSTSFSRPLGVAWDAGRQQLLVADGYSGEVVVLSSAGATLGTLGGFGSAPGQLASPVDVDVVSGTLIAVAQAVDGVTSLFRTVPESAPPTVSVATDATVCLGSGSRTAIATGGGADVTYAWGATGAAILSGQGTSSVTWTPLAAGTATLAVTATRNGFSSTSTATVAVLAPPAVVASSTGPACEGGTVQLSASFIAGATYQWTGPNGFVSAEPFPTVASVTPYSSGTYTVTVSAGGCTASASTGVVVTPRPPVPSISTVAAAAPGATGLVARITATAGTSTAWLISNGTITSGQGTTSITFTAGDAGTTDVFAIVANGPGCDSSSAATIAILDAGNLSISPRNGPAAGGTPVTIRGTGFAAGATVTIGGAPATGVSFVDAQTITAVTPANPPGIASLTVTNPGGLPASLARGFFYFPAPSPKGFYTVAPCRVIDTRDPAGPQGGPPLAGGGVERVFAVAGLCGVPTDAAAVALNVTVVGATGAGHLAFFPGDGLPPETSTINFPALKVRANNATVYLATDGTGTFTVRNGAPQGTVVDLVVDVNGFYR